LAKYELHDGKIVEISRGSGDRADICRNIHGKISREITLLDLPYLIPDRCLLKIPGKDTVYQPDIVVLERSTLSSELQWQELSVILNPSSVRLVVDLIIDEGSKETCPDKCWDYEDMKIPEYWIAEYQDLPDLKRNGKSGRPCFTVSSFIGGGYQVGGNYQFKKFTGNEAIESVVFSYLKSTVNQFFNRS
jgi:Uma2 family endonuclease